MKLKAIIPLALAVVMGLVAVQIGKRVIDRRPVVQPPQLQAGTRVVAAKHDLPAGQQLATDDLLLISVPADLVPATTFTSLEDASGRVLAAPAAKGQMVLETLLAPKGSMAGLQAIVPKGMRAATVEVNEVSGLAGLITPGCKVDVVATLQDEKTRETVGRTIVQNVTVSAVGQQLNNPQPNSKDKPSDKFDAPLPAANQTKSVTLIVSPEQAEAIDLASTKAKLRLVLRSAGDDAPRESAGVTITQLTKGQSQVTSQFVSREELGSAMASLRQMLKAAASAPAPAPAPAPAAPVKAPEPPAPQRWAVQVIRGGAESVIYFDPTGKESPTRESPTRESPSKPSSSIAGGAAAANAAPANAAPFAATTK